MLPAHFLHALKMGILPTEEIIRWADARIAEDPEPAGWLIDLSLSKVDRHEVARILIREGLDPEPDEETFLALVAFGFFHGSVPADHTVRELYGRYGTGDWSELTPWMQEIHVLDHLLDENQLVKVDEICRSLLQPYLLRGESLMSQPF